MFDAPYEYRCLGRERPVDGFPEERWFYKFEARHRAYLVYVELYDIGVVAIKYLDRRDKGSAAAFTRTFTEPDSDAVRVITTCLHIMRDYWRANLDTSFVFIGMRRAVVSPEVAARRQFDRYPERAAAYSNARFSIYRYAMKNLFSPAFFTHYFDERNNVYLLLNAANAEPVSLMEALVSELAEHYEDVFFDSLHGE